MVRRDEQRAEVRRPASVPPPPRQHHSGSIRGFCCSDASPLFVHTGADVCNFNAVPTALLTVESKEENDGESSP